MDDDAPDKKARKLTPDDKLQPTTSQGQRNFQCSECSKPFSTEHSRDQHQQMSHSEGAALNAACAHCDKMFKNQIAMLQHERKIHNHIDSSATHTCTDCNKLFATAHQLQQHSNVHKQDSSGDTGTTCEQIKSYVICELCKKTFPHEEALLRHHDKSHEKVECGECKLQLRGIFELTYHKAFECGKVPVDCAQNSNSEPEIFTCAKCPRSFKKKFALNVHIQDCHKDALDMLVVSCKHCGLKFPSGKELGVHRRGGCLVNNADIKCPDGNCIRQFTRMFDCKQHWFLTHNRECLVKCYVCNKDFWLKSELTIHVRTHLPGDSERYVASCDECDQLFCDEGDVVLHKQSVHASFANVSVCRRCKQIINRNLIGSHLEQCAATHKKRKLVNEQDEMTDQLPPVVYQLSDYT